MATWSNVEVIADLRRKSGATAAPGRIVALSVEAIGKKRRAVSMRSARAPEN
jgi:hypothetical protein